MHDRAISPVLYDSHTVVHAYKELMLRSRDQLVRDGLFRSTRADEDTLKQNC